MSTCIVEGDRQDPVLSFAAAELARWLPPATGNAAAADASPDAPAPPGSGPAAAEPRRIVLRIADEGERARFGFSGSAEEYHVGASGSDLLVLGQDAKGVLNGVYAYLESLGFLFDIGGVRPPAAAEPGSRTALHGRPSIRRRGIRLHMNFPMDQSAWTLSQVREYVDNAARMRLNYLVLHVYPMLVWLDWDFLGVRDRAGEMFSDEVYPVPDVEGVREAVGNRAVFYPPEVEEARDDRDAVYRHAGERYREIIRHAHRRGIRVGISLEVLPFTPGFLDEVKRRLRLRTLSRDQYLAMVRARFRAMLDAYREADEFHGATAETSNLLLPETEAGAELERMGRRYDLPAPWLAMVRSRGEANPEFPRIVASMLQTAELSRDLFAEAGVAEPVLMIYDALPDNMNAVAEVVHRVWRPYAEVHLLTDYGAYSVTRAMPAWERFAGSMTTGLVTWIQFDGLMYLLQNSVRSFSRGVDLARRYGIETIYVNHWSVSGLEVISAFAAAKMWDADLDPDRFYAAHLGRRWGLERTAEAVAAFDAIEELTEYCTDNLFNIGFSCPGWVTSKEFHDIHRSWTPERLASAIERCRKIAAMLEAILPGASAPAGRAHVALLLNRIECSAIHLRSCLRMKEWRVARAADRPRIRAEHTALALAYLRHHARFTLNRSDEGMLASYFRVIARNEHVLHPDDAAG